MKHIAVLFLSIFSADCIVGMEKSNEYSKYGSVDLCLTFARSDDLTNQSWKNIHTLLDHYQHEKKAKKFSLNLLLNTMTTSWDAVEKSDETVSLTPIVSFYKACKDSPQSSPQKIYITHQLILCGTEDATYFPKPDPKDARIYKLLQLSAKAWRTEKAYNEIGWNTILSSSTELCKKIENDTVTKKDCTDTITTWYNVSIDSKKTIWGDASLFKTQDSQLLDS